jgi:hypothetical protein
MSLLQEMLTWKSTVFEMDVEDKESSEGLEVLF